MKSLICLTLSIFFVFNISATETCSRTALINNQEVLVDSNSTDKGEGLRFHLEKDPIAKQYLDTYQKNSSIFWPNAFLGTVGTSIFFYGFFSHSNQDREIYIISGASLILVNFLMAKTLEITNETNLQKAVEEYNKRNLPKIYFSPEENRSQNDLFQYRVGLLNSWSF